MKKLTLLSSVLCLLTSGLVAGVADSSVRQNINGIDVVTLKTGVKDVVTIRGNIAAGDSRSPDTNLALADLTAGMLDKGTTTRDKYAISKLLGDVGATITFSTTSSALNINAKCLRADLPLVLGLIAEQLRTPAFSPEEFAKLKKQVAGLMKRQLEDTDFRAGTSFVRAVYPVGHPNRDASPEEYLAAADKATLDEVKAFHKQYYGPATMHLVIVGDVEPAAVSAELGKVFTGWTGGVPEPRPARAGRVDAPREQDVFMADKTNVSIMWGQATQLRYGEPDTLALRLGTAALGNGFTGRLMANVRDKEGLTYGIASFVSADTFVDGDWRIQANFAPENLAKGIESTKRQLMAWHKDGITAQELASNKGKFVGSFKLGLATTTGLATQILNTVNRDLPLTFIDEYGNKINALTVEQVNGAIKKHLNPEQMVLVKAGTIPGAVNK
jgi:zinc protease